MEHESDSDTNYNWRALYGHQDIGKRTGGLGNERTSRDYSNCNIIVIAHDTMKRYVDLMKLVIKDSNRKPSANAGVKNCHIIIIIIIIISFNYLVGWLVGWFVVLVVWLIRGLGYRFGV